MRARPFLLLCGLIAGCSSLDDSLSGRSAPVAQPTGWRAVLVAGDDAEAAFDNAVDTMAQKLENFGVPAAHIRVLKADGRGPQQATGSNIREAFVGLAPEPADGCFVFATSHGGPGKGLFMRPAAAFLTPDDLGRLLAGPCRSRPTVVIASGCFSGSFAEGSAMPAANRVILTAARDDRPSFGCSVERRYTVFDECVLDNLEGGATWWDVMSRARACVAANERALGVDVPSQPQLWIGADVAGLLVFAR